MNFIKAEGVPLPVTLFGILMTIGGTMIGLGALFDPTTAIDFVDGADKMGIAWGGRNTGLAVMMGAAVLLRNVFAYAAAFAGSIFRELSDLMAGLFDGGSFTSALAIVVFMLALDVICFGICTKNALASRAETA